MVAATNPSLFDAEGSVATDWPDPMASVTNQISRASLAMVVLLRTISKSLRVSQAQEAYLGSLLNQVGRIAAVGGVAKMRDMK